MEQVLSALRTLFDRAKTGVAAQVCVGGKVDAQKLQAKQVAAHGLAYFAAELAACREITAWGARLGAFEQSIAQAYVAEFARNLRGGIDLGACETVGLHDLGVTDGDVAETIGAPAIAAVLAEYGSADRITEIARKAREVGTGSDGLTEELLSDIRRQFRKFTDAEVMPLAQGIHQKDVLIPLPLIAQMAELGVFGLTIPEAYGGLGLSKVAMCVMTEELSRGYIGVGSLGTRSEIAAELILGGGTEAQKREWLPKIASGEVLPTAVFTEPNFGSDLAHIVTRAEKRGDGSYAVFGQKTWITHAVRADLMTLMVRTNPKESGYAGLSMLLAPKSRGTADAGDAAFPDAGITGTEFPVLGYRGMKEYELSFDGFAVPAEGLLGGEEGAGFKQLMRTFESARIQTAARAVGLAQAALEDAILYSGERVQFGHPIAQFPRVARKIGRMVARTQAARQLTYYAARRKDSGERSDLEAGMAKLLATRAAWEAADANVQIHGGNGYAVEYTASRLLVDARVLSIFEGANEVQAHVIARRLLEE